MSKPKSYRVAVVGATGLVGQEMLEALGRRAFPVGELILLASQRSAGQSVAWQNRSIVVQQATQERLADVDIVLMSAGADGQTIAALAQGATAGGAVVIDNSATFRQDVDVPLVVPEVNAQDIAGYRHKRIVANPNCSTIQLMVALGPLHAAATAKRLVITTYQAVSGAGKRGVDELGQQVAALYNQGDIHPEVFTKRIAFNCVPHIGSFGADGYSAEENKMRDESRRILHAPGLGVCATCVRVPVFNGHAVCVTAEFAGPMDAARARSILRTSPGVLLEDDPSRHIFPTPADAQGSDATHVGRLRDDPSRPNSIVLWCVADNLRKGAATNAVQIAEILARAHLNG